MTDVTDIHQHESKEEREAREQAEAMMNGSGKSIEDMADETPEDEEGQQLLDFGDNLNLSIKGKKPTESKIKFRTVQRDITGQIGDKSDDESYVFVVVGRLQDIQTPMKRDEAGRVITRKRVHVLDPVDVQLVPEDMAEDLLTQLDARGGDES